MKRIIVSLPVAVMVALLISYGGGSAFYSSSDSSKDKTEEEKKEKAEEERAENETKNIASFQRVAQKEEADLQVGDKAPAFQLPNLDGRTVKLDTNRRLDKPVMLFFNKPGCPACADTLPDVPDWQREHSRKLTIYIISKGSREDNRADATKHNLSKKSWLWDEDEEVFDDYGVDVTPSAVLVRTDGKIGKPIAEGKDEIESLVEEAV